MNTTHFMFTILTKEELNRRNLHTDLAVSIKEMPVRGPNFDILEVKDKTPTNADLFTSHMVGTVKIYEKETDIQESLWCVPYETMLYVLKGRTFDTVLIDMTTTLNLKDVKMVEVVTKGIKDACGDSEVSSHYYALHIYIVVDKESVKELDDQLSKWSAAREEVLT